MHKLPQPVKLWYTGPMFRYEAPQAGRYRQHSQVGAEAIGSDDPAVDAELIDLLAQLYARLGLTGVRLHLTSIGDPETRAEYARELRDFLLRQRRVRRRAARADRGQPDAGVRLGRAEIAAVTDAAPKMLDRLSRRGPRALRRGAAAARRRRRSTTSSTRGWCAGSTTTRAPCSSSAPTRSARRAASAAAAATTA